MACYYRETYELILSKLQNGNLIHADETPISIRGGGKSYIWAFTSLEEVVYIYSPTREGEFLKELLAGFNGVLVTDFYAAYDSIECPQQKCLIHLIRDMNDDLRANPFDTEYKALIQDFSHLLQSIVQTIDTYGLKKRHLRKHKKDVDRFYRKHTNKEYETEIVQKYIKRLSKHRETLFTFLDHDGVPWNNNNAEHAIKAFAVYRRVHDGSYTEGGVRDYLILLSVYETCKYKDIDFLQFLLSGATDIDEYASRRTRKKGGRI